MAKLKITHARVAVETLPVQFFREGAMFVAYCPPLDLSTCGPTFDAARANFIEALEIFFTECRKRGTLEAALTACGWTASQSGGHRQLSPPVRAGEEEVPVPVAALA